jgi:hypothetical protein
MNWTGMDAPLKVTVELGTKFRPEIVTIALGNPVAIAVGVIELT